VGWADGELITFALADYAGLANDYIKDQRHTLGTEVRGYVIECELADDKAQITLALLTTKALTFAQSIEDLVENNFDFLNTPTIFGAKAQDVVDENAKPALATTFFHVTFMNSPLLAPLPDLVQLINDPKKGQLPLEFEFSAIARGKDAEGGDAELRVVQVCEQVKVKDGQTCSMEIVEIQALNGEEDD
jgi:hypothetical protein